VIAGLPGVGIGGIFYLVCALLMPFVELANTLRGRTSTKRWKIVFTQFGMLCSIIVSLGFMGWFLVSILRKTVPSHVSHLLVQQKNVFQGQAFLLSLAFLIAIFALLHASNYIRDRNKRNHPPKGR